MNHDFYDAVFSRVIEIVSILNVFEGGRVGDHR